MCNLYNIYTKITYKIRCSDRRPEGSKPLESTRKHCAGAVFSHITIEISAQTATEVTGRSKSLLEKTPGETETMGITWETAITNERKGHNDERKPLTSLAARIAAAFWMFNCLVLDAEFSVHRVRGPYVERVWDSSLYSSPGQKTHNSLCMAGCVGSGTARR